MHLKILLEVIQLGWCAKRASFSSLILQSLLHSLEPPQSRWLGLSLRPVLAGPSVSGGPSGQVPGEACSAQCGNRAPSLGDLPPSSGNAPP